MNKRQQDIAYELAQKAHEGQFRRDGVTPYFNHVVDVARIAQMRGGDDLVIATALLHDYYEENPNKTTTDLLNAGILPEVVVAVVMLTHIKKGKNKESYSDYVQTIKNSNNQLAIKVKIADNLSNLADDPTDKQILKYAKSLQILMQD